MAKRKASSSLSHWTLSAETRSVLAGVVCVFLALLIIAGDPSSRAGTIIQQGGTLVAGAWYKAIVGGILLVLGGLLSTKQLPYNSARLLGLILYVVSSVSLVEYGSAQKTLANVSILLRDTFGHIPALSLLIGTLLLSLWLTLRISYRNIVAKIIDRGRDMGEGAVSVGKTLAKEARSEPINRRARELEEEIRKIDESKRPMQLPLKAREEPLEKHVPIHFWSKKDTAPATQKPSQEPQPHHDWSHFQLPTIDLLRTIEHTNQIDESEVRRQSLQIEKALLQFHIEVEMREAKIGPTVTQYRLRPAEGVKLSKIENLKKDLALALHAKSLRIQAPIPGVGLVGIEVPNPKRDSVGLREIFESQNFIKNKSPLAFAVGKDINGEFIVGDLTKMPHLLVAGQTASGKSVGVNGMLVSLLMRHTPATLRMILIDPKRVEFELYDGIPHLLTPVINDPTKALNALKWAVGEMLTRYDELKSWKVKNLEEYNSKVDTNDRMHYIVIVIDELADLMMSGNKKEVEHSIARLTQMARAVGMHLVVATQRPSVDVITGLIKANMPSRIAFSLPSAVDSRTILDRMGAEDLLGYGDLLYSPVGMPEPERIQGAYMTTEEVEKIVNVLKKQVEHLHPADMYDMSISEGEKKESEISSKSEFGAYEEDPAIIEEAIQIVRSAGKASTTMLQRRLQLGYARAARVIEILEGLGVVGPADGSKPREVL